MNTDTAIRAIAAAANGRPVLFAGGATGLLATTVADRPNHYYLGWSGGLVSSVGIGVALHAGHPTVVVDDMASLLANLAAVVTAGMLTNLPLVHVVLDDTPPAYAGGGAVPGARTDLCDLAMAAGYPRTYTVDNTENLSGLIRTEVANCPSPVLIRCLLGRAGRAAQSRPGRVRRRRIRRSGRRDDPPAWFTDAA